MSEMVSAYYVGYEKKTGKPDSGIRIGKDLQDIALTLDGEGIAYTHLAPDSGDKQFAAFVSALNPFDGYMLRRARLGYYRLCQTFLRRDITIDVATGNYAKECPHPTLKSQLRTFLHARQKQGRDVSEVYKKLSSFPAEHVAMIEAAEKSGGSLQTAFDRLVRIETVHHRNDLADIPTKLNNWFVYALLALLAIYIGAWYVPNLIQTQKDMHMANTSPDPFIAVIGNVGNFLSSPQGIVFATVLVGLAITLFRKLRTNDTFAMGLEWVTWRIPGMQQSVLNLDRQIALEMLAGFTATEIESTRALELTAPAMKSPRFRAALLRQKTKIEQHIVNLSESFAGEPLWGADVIALLSAANEGSITELLSQLADDYEIESEASLKVTSAAKNNAHLLIGGALTAVAAIAVYGSVIAFNLNAGAAVYNPSSTANSIPSPTSISAPQTPGGNHVP
jgi:type II secretory pathway component PulF